MPDAVTDHEADPAVRQFHHVVPVAADLQRRRGRLVPGREAGRQLGRAEERALHRDHGRALLVGLSSDRSRSAAVLGPARSAVTSWVPSSSGIMTSAITRAGGSALAAATAAWPSATAVTA